MQVNRLRAVLFDVDGVLLDSLTPHLKICKDKNEEYGLGLKIPSAANFKKLVRTGVRISPMQYFFMAVGFPEKFADKANLQYQKVFMRCYTPKPFPGVYRTLKGLHKSGLELGIVTSNVRRNVVDALGTSIQFFRPDCIFSKDSVAGSSKTESILTAMKVLRARGDETIYVGDQPADWEAAQAAGVHFLGTAYGWGISAADKEFPVVKKASDIFPRITKTALLRQNQATGVETDRTDRRRA